MAELNRPRILNLVCGHAVGGGKVDGFVPDGIVRSTGEQSGAGKRGRIGGKLLMPFPLYTRPTSMVSAAKPKSRP